jgi:CheY-like chemotaxis protein
MARILIVDDEPSVADSVELILKDAGYVVSKSFSGKEALKTAAAFRPYLLLTDVLMPGMNGFELGLAIKEALPHCRLIMFSGQGNTQALALDFTEQFTSLGYHFELVPKPIHPTLLLAKIAGMIWPQLP